MKKLVFFLSCAIVGMAASAQKVVNDPMAEKRNAGGFHAISISNGIDLYLSQGNESVVVSASEAKYRDRIKADVKDGVLTIWYDQKSNLNIDWGSNRKMKAYVSFKNLDKLTASGGSDIDIDGTINVTTLSLHISGGSDFDGKVEANDLKVEASGGSDATISGSVRNLSVTNSGGSDFKGYGLTSDVCSLNASGGSDAYITVNKELIANASGGSDVSYKGDATVRETSSGSSSVTKAGR